MSEREKIINRINKILEETDEYDGVLWDVISMLKEQDNCENCAIEDRIHVVRCKDCKYVNVCEIAHRFGEKEDWFCADGKSKDSLRNQES